MSIPAPTVEYAQVCPILIVFGAAIVGVLIEAFVARPRRYGAQLGLSLGSLAAALIAVVVLARPLGTAVMGAVTIDGPALFLQGAILLVGIVAAALIAERRLVAFAPQGSAVPGSNDEKRASEAGFIQTEVFPLTMLSIGGMLVFVAAGDLLTMFIALEVFSLPLYVMCGLASRRRLLSQEAALKYFLLGAFASAFFLFGVAMLYGYAGTLSLSGIGEAITTRGGQLPLALIGVALLSVGLLFKVGAVPFHSWIPDVYQGAPTPLTAFMAAATKIAAFGAVLRVFYVALPGLTADWRPLLSVAAALTMVVAAVLTVTQDNVKRLLAYSSVTNAGFLLIGTVAANDAGLSATLFYLVAYGFTAVGAFGVVGLIRNAAGDEEAELREWTGLGRRHPVFGAVFALFLLAMAGIPLTSGFVSKLAVFSAAMTGGLALLVVVGVISSVIAAYAYVKVIVAMYFHEPATPTTTTVTVPGWWASTAITLGAAVTVGLGIAPEAVLQLASHAGPFMR
ncbi:NADH-quinone oxidoreductase subunit NuoN [Mycobacterium avium]|uniref:NADH-quinone oxidoreductase subunit NuoN n=2 Tax=Mycobacterium avium TaxID=1764 RepID=UPI001CD95607|nr:NADH-quinone oxidoreductase subunit NuoN [Mycobacterium avium]MCA2259385.1 NADH-quinone oxidoreductase subunit NuoN [Mycobacterium avium]MCA2280587.1 NADH-quinone oxidoreductase subunit NuoN [Mycobacterium avium]MCA2289591.1 NADH-quinone oxidoreductase subunit NuoN [Mycobacterium avium]MCA2300382.1 NADH-quinone oxidoreductase subunit NuoN [Mycobacterium avium]MCA2362734.1 NADH-quinone oxidoreductase subunit NuoN [Mycobacterium avium]